MISPATAATLNMLRRAPRPTPVAVPTKRPTGGRPNPCASHREGPHPAALARLAGRPNRRGQQLGGSADKPVWRRFADAVLDGRIPVGQPITSGMITKVIGMQVHHGMESLATTLCVERLPVRIRAAGHNKWIATLA